VPSEFNHEVQHWLLGKQDLSGCLEAASLPGSMVELVSDRNTFLLSQSD